LSSGKPLDRRGRSNPPSQTEAAQTLHRLAFFDLVSTVSKVRNKVLQCRSLRPLHRLGDLFHGVLRVMSNSKKWVVLNIPRSRFELLENKIRDSRFSLTVLRQRPVLCEREMQTALTAPTNATRPPCGTENLTSRSKGAASPLYLKVTLSKVTRSPRVRSFPTDGMMMCTGGSCSSISIAARLVLHGQLALVETKKESRSHRAYPPKSRFSLKRVPLALFSRPHRSSNLDGDQLRYVSFPGVDRLLLLPTNCHTHTGSS